MACATYNARIKLQLKKCRYLTAKAFKAGVCRGLKAVNNSLVVSY